MINTQVGHQKVRENDRNSPPLKLSVRPGHTMSLDNEPVPNSNAVNSNWNLKEHEWQLNCK